MTFRATRRFWKHYQELPEYLLDVVEFHKLLEMQSVTLRVLRWEERDKRLVIQEKQMVA